MSLFPRKEWFIEAPWGRLCIMAWGDALKPPMLLIHGESDSCISFEPLLNQLPTDYYYVGIEFPGHGLSDRFPQGMPIALWDLVYVVERVRSHFRWEKFTVMAHSFGCTIERMYNLTHPGRVERVIELDHLSFPTEVERFGHWYDTYLANYFKKYEIYNTPRGEGPVYTLDEAISKIMKKRGVNPTFARTIVDRLSEPADNGCIRFTFDQRSKCYLCPPYTPEYMKQLYTGMDTPTLGILTEQSINKGLYSLTPYLLEDDAKGTYRAKIVSGSHNVHMSHPEAVAPHVSQFLTNGIQGLSSNKSKL